MALHDYRRSFDLYGGRMVATEVNGDEVEIHFYSRGIERDEVLTLSKQDAGLLLDHLAGAIRTLEGLDLTAAQVAEQIGLKKRESGL
jgi:hypothetical protein